MNSLRRWKTHFERRSGYKLAAAKALVTLGVIELFLDPAGLFFPNQFAWRWVGFVLVVVASLLIGAYLARPRNSVSRSLPPQDVKITIRVGDVLEETGNLIVGSNDFFDTETEAGIISPDSVQGQLLARTFRNDRTALDRQIGESLAGVESESVTDKPFGKLDRFPIGTVAVVESGERRVFLTAMARMVYDGHPHVESSGEEVQIAIASTWKAVRAKGQRAAVHMPIIGSNFGRLPVTRTVLIQMIILSFIADGSPKAVASSLTIYISPDAAHIVDMAALDQWLRFLCAP